MTSQPRCEWCGEEFDRSFLLALFTPYCSPSHRQRGYRAKAEKRRAARAKRRLR